MPSARLKKKKKAKLRIKKLSIVIREENLQNQTVSFTGIMNQG